MQSCVVCFFCLWPQRGTPNSAIAMPDNPAHNQIGLTLLCEYFMTDAAGKASFVGVFERFEVKTLPAVIARYYFIMNILNPRDETLRIQIQQPNGTCQDATPVPVREATVEGRLNCSVESQGMVFTEVGIYYFMVLMDDKEIGRHPLEIRMLEA